MELSQSLSRVFAIVLEAKGGTSKSFLTGLIAAAAEAQRLKAGYLDSDGSNSVTKSAFPDAHFVDLTVKHSKGKILKALREVGDGTFDCFIFDTGARDEQHIRDLLPSLARDASEKGVTIIAFRPITTSNFVHRNATQFVEFAQPHKVGVVFASIIAQGRTQQDMRFWRQSNIRAQAAKFAVEIDIEDAGSFVGDNASGFGLSLADIANGRFDRLSGDDLAEAKELFTEDVQLFVLDYLIGMNDRIGSAVTQAKERLNPALQTKKK